MLKTAVKLVHVEESGDSSIKKGKKQFERKTLNKRLMPILQDSTLFPTPILESRVSVFQNGFHVLL